jgi:hypothetical protein
MRRKSAEIPLTRPEDESFLPPVLPSERMECEPAGEEVDPDSVED